MIEMQMTGEQFSEIINSLFSILTETRIIIDPDEFSVMAVDMANTSLIQLTLSKRYFKKYVCDEATEIGIDICQFHSAIKPKKADLVEWVIDGEYSIITINQRTFRIKNPDHNKMRKRPKAIEVSLPNMVEIEAGDLFDFCKTASVMSEKMKIIMDNVGGAPELKFYSENIDDSISESVFFDALSSLDKYYSLFSFDLIMPVARALKDKRKITLEFTQDHPVKISKINLGGDIDSSVTYLIAPRIEDD